MTKKNETNPGDEVKIHGYGVDVFGTIAEKLSTLGSFTAMVKELVQNADDEKSEYITFDFCNDGLRVINASIFSEKDFERIIRIAARGKESESHKTGAFGIGFVSVYLVTDHPEVQSAGKKFIFHPENISVPEYISEIKDHTEFFLPWASNPNSEIRKELRRQAVTKNDIPKQKSELLEAIPNIMLFLRNLRRIIVMGNGIAEIEYFRDDKNPPHRKVVQTIGNKSTTIREWLVYEFESQEPDKDADQLNKESKIGIAFPLSQEEIEKGGMLYDFLPTGLFTGYRFHINGDFFPTSDRQRIILDGSGPKVAWNIKVIGNIGRLLANCLSDLKSNLGIKLFDYLPDVDYNNANLPTLNLIKSIFFQLSKNEQIIPDEAGSWYKHDCIFLIDTKDENERRTLAEINIPIVNSKLRTKWTLIQQGLGVKNLDLGTAITFIQKKNIKAGIFQSEAPKPFNTVEGIYNTLLFVQDRLKTKSEEKFLSSFSLLPICPDQTGHLNQFVKLKIISPSVEKALPKLSGTILVNYGLQAKHNDVKDVLLRLSAEFSWRDVIDIFHGKNPSEIEQLEKNNIVNLKELYDYLSNHETEILKDAVYRDKLVKSCIFMTNKQFKPLSGLCLSGNYKDIIGLDIIISEANLSGKVQDFLKKLGVKSLDFPTYVVKYVPDYFTNESAWKVLDKRLELAEEIRKNFSQVSDLPQIRSLLKSTKLVPCNDGNFHCPENIYLESDLLRLVLGLNYLHPDENMIGTNLNGWIEWLKLLGVNKEPKSEDLIKRIRKLASTCTPENILAIERLFYYLVEVFDRDDFDDEKSYLTLKTLAWIPIENTTNQYYIPSDVYLPFGKHLFFSQAKFVPFKQLSKMGGKFPTFLEIGNSPKPIQMMRHLEYLSAQNLLPENRPSVIYNIYRELNVRNEKITDGEISILRDIKCIYIDGFGYKKPIECFSQNHPFGVFRFQIGEELKNSYSFIKRTGVRDEPELQDYIDVLQDISDVCGNKVIEENTQIVVKDIYRYFISHLNEITEQQFAEISQFKSILDRNGLLRMPGHIFFEDKGVTVDIFRQRLINELIDKKSDTWPLFQKMGVRNLSQAIRPVDFKPSNDINPSKDDADLFRGRKRAIITIVETQKKDFGGGWDLNFFNYLQIFEASQLTTKYEVTIDGHSVFSPEQIEQSFYDQKHHRLFVCSTCVGKTRTYEIARNLASILNPEIDPCHVLPVLVEVLDPTRDENSVQQYLRQMGFDIIIEQDSEIKRSSAENNQNLPIVDSPSSIVELVPQTPDIEKTDESEAGDPNPDEAEKRAAELLNQMGKPTRKRSHSDSGDHTAEEINRKRKIWLNERLLRDYGDHPSRDSEYPIETHAMLPEEIEQHRKIAAIFYNRQIQDLESRLGTIQEGNGPTNYSLYGTDWDEISKIIRERDGNKCRRCGLSETDGITLVVHHIYPRKDGGSNWHSNLITLCRICHAEVEDHPWLL